LVFIPKPIPWFKFKFGKPLFFLAFLGLDLETNFLLVAFKKLGGFPLLPRDWFAIILPKANFPKHYISLILINWD